MDTYDVIRFSQYESDSEDDDLLLFAAPAKQIWRWAGIPRKGWDVRMLFQRWITPARQQEVTAFWDYASQSVPHERQGKNYILGPTALTVAVFDSPEVESGKIALKYEPPFAISDERPRKLSLAATVVVDRMSKRLTPQEKEVLLGVRSEPTCEFPDVSPNWVLQSLCQIVQAASDPEYFVQTNNLTDGDVDGLIESLEALCRPALVVDGQHRLYGAAHAAADIWLPIVAMPNSPWTQGIYQFIVINEKAQRVDTGLLTDIFGSSLTPTEQKAIESQLDRSGARVQERIAAVVAARDEDSPFYELVRFSLQGESQGIIPTLTVRQLIEGGSRGARGWRSDTEFYTMYVKPTFPNAAEWDSWTDGKWKDYWFAFWAEVRDYYNAQASNELWTKEAQTNLTKAVSLRLFQRLFIEKMIESIRDVVKTRETLAAMLKDEERADEAVEAQIKAVALPDSINEFRTRVREQFLEKGVPVRVFERPWVSSLDDQQGQQYLYEEFLKAYESSQRDTLYYARNKDVFAVTED
ncbi:MAG TPA: hypothetical protein VGP18_13780 [Solirubrobacteraceae bacterium]|jgi:hypothetical protein|nr:hypothetical protein [Solirubrobacteraceae bacterium]